MKSKYEVRGAYHYAEFKKDTPYRHHVLDLVREVTKIQPLPTLPVPKLLDIGCGEGLVMSEFAKHGFQCTGLEIDKTAIKLGRAKGNVILDRAGEDMIFAEKFEVFDVVLLCDVLEHTVDPIRVMNIAKQLGNIVVVATPDREDKHAEHEVRPDAVMTYFMGWELLHCRQRHARWLMIFKKIR